MSIRAVGTCVIGVGRRNVADSIISVTVSVQSTVTVLIIDTLEVVGTVRSRTAIVALFITAALRSGFLVLTASIGAVNGGGPVTGGANRILESNIKGEGPLAIAHWVISSTWSTLKEASFPSRATLPESATI